MVTIDERIGGLLDLLRVEVKLMRAQLAALDAIQRDDMETEAGFAAVLIKRATLQDCIGAVEARIAKVEETLAEHVPAKVPAVVLNVIPFLRP